MEGDRIREEWLRDGLHCKGGRDRTGGNLWRVTGLEKSG